MAQIPVHGGGRVELLSLKSGSLPEPECLPPQEWERAQSFQEASRRLAFLAGRGLLRQMLHACRPDLAPADIPVEIPPEGKPSCPLPGMPFFNLSHTRDTVGLAVSPHGPVGLDLEDMTRTVDVKALARRWFHAEEQAVCAAADFAPEAFFRMWTRKEALLKAGGTGLRGGWSRINTLETEREGTWVFTEAVPAPGLCLCAVALTPMIPVWR